MNKPPLSPAHPFALRAGEPQLGPRSAKQDKRQLRRLAAGNGWLEPVGSAAASGGWRLVTAGTPAGDDAPRIEAHTVDTWRRHGWVEATPAGVLRLTSLGLEIAGAGRQASDGISSHRRQHGLVGEEVRSIEGEACRVRVDAAESPLGWLLRRHDRHGRPLLDRLQYEAGERLRADFTLAGLSSRVTARWDQTIASGARGRSSPGDASVMTERAMDARRRVHRALAAAGPELAGMLLEVCCLASGLEAAERRLGLPQRCGKVVLQIALARLVEHYGLAGRDSSREGAVRIRSWGSEDYRPQLFGSASEQEI